MKRQRRLVIQPKVARNELPWASRFNTFGVAHHVASERALVKAVPQLMNVGKGGREEKNPGSGDAALQRKSQ